MADDNEHKRFWVTLRPFFDLMDHKRILLSNEEWLMFIGMVKSSVIKNPEQFLGKELPEEIVLRQVIDDIFDEYLIDASDSVPA